MDLILSIILVILSILEIRKGFLILRKNQIHTFLGIQIIYFILRFFVSEKKFIEIQKAYKKRMKFDAKMSNIVWILVFLYNIFYIWLIYRKGDNYS